MRFTVKKSVYLILGLFMTLTVHAQAADDPVTLNVKRQSVVEILKELEKQSSYKFMFHDEDLLRLGQKDINVRNVPLAAVLDECLKGSDISYRVTDNQIVFMRNSRQQPQARRTITGTVVNAAGKPVAGASVVIQGSYTGTSTDAQGKFSLSIPGQGQTVLNVTFIGYKSEKVAVGTQSELKITLHEEAMEIGNVVVTGYGTYSSGEMVGAYDVLKAEDILITGESTIDQMLQGQVAGMSVLNTTGKVGGAPKIRIRGTSTILGNAEPLWVVDGVIQTNPLPLPDDASPIYDELESMRETAGNAISWLNPADIETITVLKDASATAIYGSKASNGVIVITTKKAKEPGLSISYGGNFTVGQKPNYRLYDLMNSQELMVFAQQVWEDRDSYNQEILPIGYGGLIQRLNKKEITREEFEKEFRKMENMNTDWFDILYRNSFNQSHNLSISSMGEKLSSRFSVGMNNQSGGTRGGDNLKSYTAHSNTTFRLDDRLIVDFNLSASYRETDNFFSGVSPYDYAMTTARTIPAYNDDGTFFYHEKLGTVSSYSIPNKSTYNYNILNEIDNTGTKTIGSTLQASMNLRMKLINNLELQAMGSYQIGNQKIKSWATQYSHYITNIRGYESGEVLPDSPEQHASALPFGGLLQTDEALTRSYSFRTALLYHRTFSQDHRLTVNLGFEMQSNNLDGNTNARYGYLYFRGETFAAVPTSVIKMPTITFANSWDLHEDMKNAAKITTTKNNTVSEYLTAVYGFKERYVVNFNARLDASNRFGQDNNKKFNPSWSVGAKWRIGNEPFMDWASSWYDMFDISFAYGWRGNAVEAVSPYLIARDGGLNTNFQQYILDLQSLPYPNLGWEKTEDWNLGLSFMFFGGKIAASMNAYGQISHVLSSREVPLEYGVANAYIDGTTMRNSGYEFTVSFSPVRTKDFTWSLSVNSGYHRNKIENNQRVNSRQDYLTGSAIVSGERFGTFWAYAFDGLRPDNGAPMFKYMDIEKTSNDLDYLVKAGCIEPNFSGGLNTMIRYKNVFLRATFALSFGSQQILPEVYPLYGAPSPEKNAPRYMLDRWRKSGDEDHTDIPAIPTGYTNGRMQMLPTATILTEYIYKMYNQSDVRVADTDFIRCRQLALQYDLPRKVSDLVHLRRISFSASMSNPFFIAFDKKWEGRDPETADWPARKSISFSLSLNF